MLWLREGFIVFLRKCPEEGWNWKKIEDTSKRQNLKALGLRIVNIIQEILKKIRDSLYTSSIQLLSYAQLFCDQTDCSKPGFAIHHQPPEPAQTHLHWVGDAIQPFHPLSSPSSPAFNLFQHQGLFKWVSSLHQVAKVLEFQLQHKSFQWISRTDLL